VAQGSRFDAPAVEKQPIGGVLIGDDKLGSPFGAIAADLGMHLTDKGSSHGNIALTATAPHQIGITDQIIDFGLLLAAGLHLEAGDARSQFQAH
jgi:hypothetical protein